MRWRPKKPNKSKSIRPHIYVPPEPVATPTPQVDTRRTPGSERRLADYGPAFETVRTASELGRLARAIYDADVERGYITALGEMVSGGSPTRSSEQRSRRGSTRR